VVASFADGALTFARSVNVNSGKILRPRIIAR
jgi:hypothetical protein